MCWALLPTVLAHVPTSLFRVATLLGWADRPMSPKAAELSGPEQAPYGTPEAGLGSKGGWTIAAAKSQNTH